MNLKKGRPKAPLLLSAAKTAYRLFDTEATKVASQ